MPEAAWEFTDDRGETVRAWRRPRRVAAYVRAGAALWDLGVRPVAVYGSAHDGGTMDPIKAGSLDGAGAAWLGSGDVFDRHAFGAAEPDLIVDVTYDGKSLYALPGPLLDYAEVEGVPTLALSVGGGVGLPRILERFASLATALDGGTEAARLAAEGAAALADAEEALRSAAGRDAPRVLALSGAGPEQAYLARPRTWPELSRLADLGVPMAEPAEGPGVNWATATWAEAAALGAAVVLVDGRAHAARPPAPDVLGAGAAAIPWNPETPCSAAAHAAFFRSVAARLAPAPAEPKPHA